MHQIQFRLGLRPRARWGSLQRSPRLLSWFRGCLLLREGRGKGEGRGRAPPTFVIPGYVPGCSKFLLHDCSIKGEIGCVAYGF